MSCGISSRYGSSLLLKTADFSIYESSVILRSRALARRLEGWPQGLVAHPSRLAVKNGEHLRMTGLLVWRSGATPRAPLPATKTAGTSFRARNHPAIYFSVFLNVPQNALPRGTAESSACCAVF